VNPKERLTASEALKHPWLSLDRMDSEYQLSDTLDHLRKYNLKRKLRAAVFTVIVTNRLTSLGFGQERRMIATELDAE
jgi:serine/threonine protein kinase